MGDPKIDLNALGEMRKSTPAEADERRETGAETVVRPWSESEITLRDTPIRYARTGTGSPVLLLHGWSSSLDAFKPLALDLAKAFDVVALDFPGHGESGSPEGAWAVGDFVALVEELLDRLDLERVDIVAHSFGARVAAKLAAGDPERVGRLVLMGAAGLRRRRSAKLKAKTFVLKLAKALAPLAGGTGQRWKHDLVKRYASRDYLDAGELRPTFVKVITEDLSSSFRAVRSETLLIWGENDQETPLGLARQMNALVDNSELMVIKGAGHFVFADKFQQVRLATRRFLSQGPAE
ncbi:MAG: alpha/beta fold hydrolase [Thermoanaerobaculia bacterium]